MRTQSSPSIPPDDTTPVAQRHRGAADPAPLRAVLAPRGEVLVGALGPLTLAGGAEALRALGGLRGTRLLLVGREAAARARALVVVARPGQDVPVGALRVDPGAWGDLRTAVRTFTARAAHPAATGRR